ncbi:MAG: DUF3098 domain-containing protein [Alistipes sp.]|jgi:hypothetical protein|nr:DUF3098 domain-containing protein [Alistipes sp.]MBO5984401.1 DUF3098 domain-containing protein [Rikenellaceae bacterium]MBO7343313.1 DUF3098 domain-containing protein [Alistipes sp.]MBQ5703694.1 DUF3098 domain-containing protein [Alistipes sp.]
MKQLLNNLRARFNAATDKNDEQMPLTVRNYVLIIAGFVVILIGMVLMTGGGSDNPEVFNYEMFSWRRITLAPILIVGGFAFEIYAILKRF